MNWKAVLTNTAVSAVFGAIFGVLGSGAVDYYNQQAGIDRQALVTSAFEFSNGDRELVPLVTAYIQAVSASKPLNDVQTQLRVALSNQVTVAEKLPRVFGLEVKPLVADYQNAITEFEDTFAGATSVTTMYDWTVEFDKMLQARGKLTEALLVEAGLSTPAAA